MNADLGRIHSFIRRIISAKDLPGDHEAVTGRVMLESSLEEKAVVV